MKRWLQIAFLVGLSLVGARASFAQAGFASGISWKYTPAGAFPYGASTVTVCTSAAIGTPCTPTISLFADSGLTIPVANPLAQCTTSPQVGCIDNLGNFSFYATFGVYTYTITGAGILGYGPVPIVVTLLPFNAFGGTINTNQVAFGTALNSFGGSGNFTYNNSTGLLTVGGGSSNSQTPRLFQVLDGSSSSYLTTLTASTPTLDATQWDATPQFLTGYAESAMRIDRITKASVDVQSGVALNVQQTVLSSDAANVQGNTAQTAILGNAGSQGTGASAPLEGINAIVSDSYTFGGSPVPQNVIGMESDYLAAIDASTFNSTTGPFGVGVLASNNNNTGGVIDGSFGFLARGVVANNGWKTGGYFAGRLAGLVVGTENNITPDVGLWVRNGTTYGIYVGGTRAIESNSFYNSSMSAGNASTALELGETATSSGSSGALQFDSTTAGSVRNSFKYFMDLNGSVNMYYNGVSKYVFTNAGAFAASTVQSSIPTGTAPLIVTSTTPVANLAATPTTYNTGGTQQTNSHLVVGTCTLGTNCGVTLSGNAAYTSSSSYVCSAVDQTGIFAVRVNQTAGNGFTITGNGTDVIGYFCGGN